MSDRDMMRIQEILSGFCLVDKAEILSTGHLRVGTKLLYPDGSGIDVFVEKRDEFEFSGITLSDFGQTFSTLLEHQVRPWETKSRLATIKETVSALRVELSDDKLLVCVDRLDEIEDAVLCFMGQACLRASCFVFTRRVSRPANFSDEVRHTIQACQLPFDENVDIPGPYNVAVRVEYRVKGPVKESSILTMSANSASSAHHQAIELYRKWVDLKNAKFQDRFITIFNPNGKLRKEDMQRLDTVSNVVPVTNKNMLHDLLVAA